MSHVETIKQKAVDIINDWIYDYGSWDSDDLSEEEMDEIWETLDNVTIKVDVEVHDE
jgi:glutathionyl-hydroquinone reductase